jgi:hypothetical protein
MIKDAISGDLRFAMFEKTLIGGRSGPAPSARPNPTLGEPHGPVLAAGRRRLGVRARLRTDCDRCLGRCCVVPAFAASADFAIDKKVGSGSQA